MKHVAIATDVWIAKGNGRFTEAYDIEYITTGAPPDGSTVQVIMPARRMGKSAAIKKFTMKKTRENPKASAVLLGLMAATAIGLAQPHDDSEPKMIEPEGEGDPEASPALPGPSGRPRNRRETRALRSALRRAGKKG